MLKNRTLIGIILIVAAIGLCFGISPLFNSILSSKTTIIRLKQDIPQGVQITGSMLEAVEVGKMNLPADMQNDPKQIIGKYTVSAMFAGDSFTDKKLSDAIDTSDSLLRQLKPNETAMSVTVRSLANGLSGKLQQGDIIQIVSVDEDDKAQIYEELQFVEVLATTSDTGSDDTYRDGEVNANSDDDEEQSLYATVTIILQDRAQALRLAECENTSLHAVFVTRGNEELKAECLKAQLDKPDSVIKDLQAKLNTAYDDFYKKFGLIHSQTNKRYFAEDVSYNLVAGLEKSYDKTKLLEKSDIFTKRTIVPPKAVEHVDTALEALTLSIAEKARVDFEYMSSLTGMTEDELKHDLVGEIFKIPHTENTYQTASEYLSGDIRAKLREAEEIAEYDADFNINVSALKQIGRAHV